MSRLAVINVVGLTEALIGEHTPRIAEFRRRGAFAQIAPAFPAVTCTAQSNYLTGKPPAHHGIVGNGWYHRDLAEIQFWKQSNHIVQSQKIWDALRENSALRTPHFANMFWWFNMYSSVDLSITPRPIYRADGGKIFDVYSWPYSLREEIKKDLGEFPFFSFWGPAAGIDSPQGKADAASRWIAESAKWIENKFSPTLNLIYLPHLDYNLQRHGIYVSNPLTRPSAILSPPNGVKGAFEINPAIHRDLREIDAMVGDLIDFFGQRGVQVVLLSEYGITNVDTPVHLNRIFREHGWLTVKDELGLEILDAGASQVFAVADHQVAHIYLNNPVLEKSVRDVLEKTPGVEKVLGQAEKIAAGIGRRARAGFCADGGHPSQAGLRPGGIVSESENSGGEIKNRVAVAAKKARPADVDGRDSARRDAGERFAWPAAGGQKRLAGLHHQPAGIFKRGGSGINGRFSNTAAAFWSAVGAAYL